MQPKHPGSKVLTNFANLWLCKNIWESTQNKKYEA